MYNTKCEYCGAEGAFKVASGTFTTDEVFLTEEGYSLFESPGVKFDDEMVYCVVCGHEAFLKDLYEADTEQVDEEVGAPGFGLVDKVC